MDQNTNQNINKLIWTKKYQTLNNGFREWVYSTYYKNTTANIYLRRHGASFIYYFEVESPTQLKDGYREKTKELDDVKAWCEMLMRELSN